MNVQERVNAANKRKALEESSRGLGAPAKGAALGGGDAPEDAVIPRHVQELARKELVADKLARSEKRLRRSNELDSTQAIVKEESEDDEDDEVEDDEVARRNGQYDYIFTLERRVLELGGNLPDRPESF